MRWQGGEESDNVEDRRGMPGGPMVVTGGLGTLVVILLAIFFGFDPRPLLQQQGGGLQPPGQQQLPGPAGAEDEMKHFVRVVLRDTEKVWTNEFRKMHKSYRPPKLVLFNNHTPSACGLADQAIGPFYCPADEKVYLDLSFFHDLTARFHAPGEFAQAYVIAHEVGHHVQDLLGISERVSAARGRVSPVEYNHLSVRLELQADFLAGAWAHHADEARHILEEGDVETALRAASAIGDDRLQRQSRGYAVPDSFTHGTSAQRVKWFRRGLASGNIADGDTFNTDDL